MPICQCANVLRYIKRIASRMEIGTLFNHFFKINFQFRPPFKIPQCETPNLVEIRPIIIKFRYMLLTRLIFRVLRIV